MRVSELERLCGATCLTGEYEDREIACGYTCDLLSHVMGRGQADMAWITVQTHMNVIAVAALMDFADKLEKATIQTIEDGKMTKSLSLISTCEHPVILNSLDFIKAIRETLDSLL